MNTPTSPFTTKHDRILRLTFGAIYVLSACALFLPGKTIIGNPLYLFSSAGMFLGMIVLWKYWPERCSITVLCILAIFVRIAAVIQFPLSDDIYRYLWEGHLQLHGHNPFTIPPDSPLLYSLRDDNWQLINHKSIPTIYWPFAQLLFGLLFWTYPSPYTFKVCFSLFDSGIIILLLCILKRLKAHPRHCILYALNPLSVIVTAGEGHVEAVMVFFVVLSVYFYLREKSNWLYLALGCAVMVKITPLILLPFFIKRRNIRALPFFFVPFVFTLPYLSGHALDMLEVPLYFAANFNHNGLVHTLLSLVFTQPGASYLAAAFFLFFYLWFFFLIPSPLKAAALGIGLFLICVPTFHPWYLLLMTPFVVLFRQPAWIALHATVLPMLFFFNPAAGHPLWHDSSLLFAMEYIPFIGTGLWCFSRNIRSWPAVFTKPETVSVIIPVYNEENQISECIMSIMRQHHPVEIIAVDAGSTDATVERAKDFPSVSMVSSKPGRGIQINEGIKHSHGDCIVIIHADSLLRENAIENIIKTLRNDPEAIGGSFSAAYEDQHFRYRCTEFLNNLRTRLTGISFGDQGQFFRRDAVSGFPPCKLMEDIEFSFALNESGKTIVIPDGLTSSTRRWQKSGYRNNFLKVIALSTAYIVMRKFNLTSSDCSEFYRVYYGKSI